MGAAAPAAIMVGGMIGSQLIGGGGDHGAQEAQFTTPYALMPQAQRDYLESIYKSYTGMPTSMPISYGGQSYQMPRTLPLQAAQAYQSMFSPIMSQPAVPPGPSPLTGAMTAMAGMYPYMMGGQQPIPYTPVGGGGFYGNPPINPSLYGPGPYGNLGY